MTVRMDTALVGSTPAQPKDVRKAAEQFEALLIAQMLKTARGEQGWMGTGDDSTAESAMGLAEEQLASMLAAQGGLGLARLVGDGLEREP
jgi:Rod binding domain-containing protein